MEYGRFVKVNLSVTANEYTVRKIPKQDIILVIDNSSSMDTKNANALATLSRREAVKNAAKAFVESLMVDGTAKHDIYDNFYIIYYIAVRTVCDTFISYKQDYTVNKTTTNITYLAEGTARLNVEDEISAPNTGVDTNNSNYLYLLLVLLPLGYVSIKKLVK